MPETPNVSTALNYTHSIRIDIRLSEEGPFDEAALHERLVQAVMGSELELWAVGPVRPIEDPPWRTLL